MSLFKKKFPFSRQLDQMDCGPTCLKMIAAYHGKFYTLDSLRQKSYFSRNGVSLKGIIEAAESIGFRAMPVKIPLKSEGEASPGFADAPLPCIVHWNQQHFVVVYDYNDKYVWIADPADGKHKLSHADFKKSWLSNGNEGIALLLEPTPRFLHPRRRKN